MKQDFHTLHFRNPDNYFHTPGFRLMLGMKTP